MSRKRPPPPCPPGLRSGPLTLYPGIVWGPDMGRRNPPPAQGTWAQVSSLPCPKAFRGFSRKYPGPKESTSLTSKLRGPLGEDLPRPRQGIGAAWAAGGTSEAFPVTGPTHLQLWVVPHHRTLECWSRGHLSRCSQPWLLVRVIFQNIKLEILT